MGLALTAAGGLGIFLLAMTMMTEGLKIFGGESLKHSLEGWTSTPLRGVAIGALVTALVQSSSAVTVATLGFVNAGILSLKHSLGLIFGANVGTTMTGWLVSVVGFGFKIEAFALPMIALGMGLWHAVQKKRLRGLGQAITGFGLFFLGLAVLKEAFAGLSETFGMATLAEAGPGAGGIALFVLVGVVATVLTQSSSAAIALILTAFSQSAIGFGAAAAAIVGANVGTTSTAAFAVIGATPNARRVAAGHILFNVGTGIIALAVLPALIWGTEALGRALGLDSRPVVVLALFHSVFNVLGVVVMLPFVGSLTAFLLRHFTSTEEDISRPQHLDRTVSATPAFAVPALEQELLRLRSLVCTTALSALSGPPPRSARIERHAEAMLHLGRAITSFAVDVRMEGMERDASESLARLLRVARYLDEAATLLREAHEAALATHRIADEDTQATALAVLAAAERCLTICGEIDQGDNPGERLETARAEFEGRYQVAKATALRAAAMHRLSIEGTDELLDAMSSTRRMIDQVIKACEVLIAEVESRSSAEDVADAEQEAVDNEAPEEEKPEPKEADSGLQARDSSAGQEAAAKPRN